MKEVAIIFIMLAAPIVALYIMKDWKDWKVLPFLFFSQLLHVLIWGNSKKYFSGGNEYEFLRRTK